MNIDDLGGLWRAEVKPSRQAEGAMSLQGQWGFEELGTQDEMLGMRRFPWFFLMH